MEKEVGTVEFFIGKVRNRPCLWNQSHVSYRDVGRKEMIWERVAKECGMANGREAKTQWKKLRDSHREALRRRKPSAGPSAQYLRPWKYEEDMKFIISQMDNRENTYNFDSTDIEDNPNDNTTDTNIPGIESSMSGSVSIDPFGDPLSTVEIDGKKREDSTGGPDKADREKLRYEREQQRDELLKQIIEMNRGDALSKFFDSLCEKTRGLPKYLQLRIQREVFDSVTRAEEEFLSINQPPMASGPVNIISAISLAREHDYFMEDDKTLVLKNIEDS